MKQETFAQQQRSVHSSVPAETDQGKAELILIGGRLKTVDKQTGDKKRQTHMEKWSLLLR